MGNILTGRCPASWIHFQPVGIFGDPVIESALTVVPDSYGLRLWIGTAFLTSETQRSWSDKNLRGRLFGDHKGHPHSLRTVAGIGISYVYRSCVPPLTQAFDIHRYCMISCLSFRISTRRADLEPIGIIRDRVS